MASEIMVEDWSNNQSINDGNKTVLSKPWEHIIPVGVILSAMVLATISGNMLVIMAVVRERKLHQLANKLVASLALTDLMVGVVVLPLAAVYTIMDQWLFGAVMCEIFISTDVILCTSSILHLATIAVDRYWTVSDVTYTRGGNQNHQYFLRLALPMPWVMSVIVYAPRWLFTKTEENLPDGVCHISQSRAYTIYSTLCAFYVPLLIIIAIYTKIFLIVRARANRDGFKNKNKTDSMKSQHRRLLGGNEGSVLNSSIKSTDVGKQSDQTSVDLSDSSNGNTNAADVNSPGTYGSVVRYEEKGNVQNIKTSVRSNNKDERQDSDKRTKKRIALKRERKALRTLLIITGIFVICWLPFFIFEVVMPFCGRWCQLRIPKVILQIANWLGYSNSMLNPIIYTIFSPDFRKAFKKILFNRC